LPKVIKPDEYSNNGVFEMARFGNQLIMHNNMTPEQFEKWQNYHADNMETVKSEIDIAVASICENVSKCDPEQLLMYCRDLAMTVHHGKYSESDYSADDNFAILALVYVQSVIVSTDVKGFESADAEKNTEQLSKTRRLIIELFPKIMSFYSYWGHNISKENKIDEDLLVFIAESQMLYLVSGNRYQAFQLDPLRNLLPPHNEILEELFGENASSILNGLNKLEYALTQGRADAWNHIIGSYRNFLHDTEAIAAENEGNHAALSAYYEAHFATPNEPLMTSFDGAFGLSLNDVKTITGWDCRFVQALTFKVNEHKDFYGQLSDYSGWPVVELPISQKPFVELKGKSYCFDYHSLFDNVYRVIQKEVRRQRPDYEQMWQQKQSQASEDMVEKLFCKLLPGAKTHKTNFYPKSASLKELYENDLLIEFDDVLLIIEIKAGSFPATPPITDYEAHIKAYRNLIEKADHQCERTLRYMSNNTVAVFYDNDKNVKLEIDTSKIRETFTFSITVDNINSFAARAEKISFLNIKSTTISLSYDDLLTYAEYFDSPMYFLHFMRQRKLSTTVKQLSLNDELEHLGMYLHYNCYPDVAATIPDDFGRIDFNGFREQLDNYFCRLHNSELAIPKPMQDVPEFLIKMIKVMDDQNSPCRVYLSSFLLDFSGDARKELVENIAQTYNKKVRLEKSRPMPLLCFGGVRYCVFINIQNKPDINSNERRDYAYATLLRNIASPLTWIDLYVDQSFNITEVRGYECKAEDILSADLDRIQALSLKYAHSRVETAKRTSPNGKLGRNEYCPCGSGKKYKKCCIS